MSMLEILSHAFWKSYMEFLPRGPGQWSLVEDSEKTKSNPINLGKCY